MRLGLIRKFFQNDWLTDRLTDWLTDCNCNSKSSLELCNPHNSCSTCGSGPTYQDIVNDMRLDLLLSVWRKGQMNFVSLSSFLPQYPSLITFKPSHLLPQQPFPLTNIPPRPINFHEMSIMGQFYFWWHILLITFSTVDWPWRLRNYRLWRICQDHDLTEFFLGYAKMYTKKSLTINNQQ